MALTSIKVSQLNGSPDKVSNEDIVYVVKALPTGEFISVKSPLSDLSNLFFENVKEDFYSYTIDKSDEERVESDEKYVHKNMINNYPHFLLNEKIRQSYMLYVLI